ncbi:MAG: ABC transporter permease [Acidimicrobiales bacterium]
MALTSDLESLEISDQILAERRRSDRRGRWFGLARAILPFAILVAIWWGVHAIFDPAPTKLVDPATVVDAFFEVIREGTLPAYIARSLGRLGLGVLIGVIVGIPVGWLLGLDRDIARAAEPALRFFNAVSGIAWLPLMIAWFGFTERTISSVIIYTMIFPVVFNTMIGVRTVPPVLRDAARSMGAGWVRVIRDVYVPGSFPSVMTGLRLGIGFGWRALIAGEFVVGGGGLGFLIFDARTAGVIERVMLGMIVLGALWLLIDRLILRPIEEYTAVKWGMVRQ